MWCQIQLVAVSLCFIILTSSEVASFQCGIRSDEVICDNVELKIDEPIEYGSTIEEIRLINVTGSFGVKTFSSYPEVKELLFYSSHISDLEEGALCSLPKLKRLAIVGDSFPILTRKHLRGCQNLEYFASSVPLKEDALQDMTGIKNLGLSGPYTNFTKAYLEPLKELTSLDLRLGKTEKVESGLFCVPTLENLGVVFVAPFEITESLFHGCDNVKKVYIRGSEVIIKEGQNPFRNLPNLEHLTFDGVVITHLTRDFLSGLPSLKKFEIRGEHKSKILLDSDAFTDVPTLIHLELSGIALEDSDLEKLYVPSKVEEIFMTKNELTDISVMKSLPNLQFLVLSNNKIVKFDLPNLKKNFPELNTIYLMNNPLDPEFEKELRNDKKVWIVTKEDQLEQIR